jgi:hypothetical protein
MENTLYKITIILNFKYKSLHWLKNLHIFRIKMILIKKIFIHHCLARMKIQFYILINKIQTIIYLMKLPNIKIKNK